MNEIFSVFHCFHSSPNSVKGEREILLSRACTHNSTAVLTQATALCSMQNKQQQQRFPTDLMLKMYPK